MNPQRGSVRASRFGAVGFTIGALVLTFATIALGVNWLSNSQYASEQVAPVVVAKKAIQASERITDEHLSIAMFPVSSIPEGHFKSKDEFLGPNPRVAVSAILPGEPILSPRLASAQIGTGMASLVPKDFRAFPLPVDKWVSTAQLVYPGAMVDVLTTVKNTMGMGRQGSTTKLVLQQVRVLAVDGAVDIVMLAAAREKKKGDSDKTIVTLLVTPEESEVLALASREGKIDLVLRNAQDQGVAETFGVAPYELLGVANPEEVEAAREQLEEESRARRATASAARIRRPAPASDNSQSPDLAPSYNGGTKTINLGAH